MKVALIGAAATVIAALIGYYASNSSTAPTNLTVTGEGKAIFHSGKGDAIIDGTTIKN